MEKLNYINFELLKKLNLRKEYSYKALCDIGIINKYASSDTKKAQLIELECCCKYKKVGTKYKITKVYDKPIILGKGEYQTDIQKLVINELKKMESTNYFISETPTILAQRLGMVNENFRIIKNSMYSAESYSKLEHMSKQFGKDVTVSTLRFCMNSVQDLVGDNLERALKTLSKEVTITFKPELKVCKVVDGKECYFNATDKEERFMMDTENMALEKVGLVFKIDLLYHPNKRKDFNKYVQEVYDKVGIKYFFETWDIRATEKSLEMGTKRLAIKEERALKRHLNENIQDGAKESAHNKTENLKEKYTEQDSHVMGRPKEATGLKADVKKKDFKETTDNIIEKVVSISTRKKIKP